ncbi:MAG: hypothetical protein BGO78_12890 [Chloroflexi bacterium 44-23]|nr:MAG: hypothetical protein BGO78_12890 [Chloroflexi bacterium 44-23]
MKPEVIKSIVDINRQFYQNFGDAFAATRRRIQPGVRSLLESLPSYGHWLDLGCGSATLALEWLKSKRTGSYTGLDFSEILLTEAMHTVRSIDLTADREVFFRQVDLSTPDWHQKLPRKYYDGIFCFAVMHHILGFQNRLNFIQQVRTLLPSGAIFAHSNWQFQNSPRLVARIQPWSSVGIDEQDLEAGDTLLDWRYQLPGQPEVIGIRYVHLFDKDELQRLAEQSDFAVIESFESDGEGGRLGLYQRWQAI